MQRSKASVVTSIYVSFKDLDKRTQRLNLTKVSYEVDKLSSHSGLPDLVHRE